MAETFYRQIVDFAGLLGSSLESPLALVDPDGIATVGSTECPSLGEHCLKIAINNSSAAAYVVDSMQLINGKDKFSMRVGYHAPSFTAPDPWGDAWTVAISIFQATFQGGIGAMTVIDGVCRAYQSAGHPARVVELEDNTVDPVERCIPVVNGTSYSLCMLFERAGLVRLRLYIAGTGEQIGAEKTWPAPDALGAYFQLGLNGFRYTVPTPKEIYFNGLVIDSTNAKFPILDYIPTYVAAFDSQGGSSVASQTVETGGLVSRPADPTRSGYRFLGWFIDAAGTTQWDFATDTITAARTLYAMWARITRTVTFESDGGSAVASLTVNEGDAIGSLPTPTRLGFSLAGWFTDRSSGGTRITTSTIVTADMTIYASWTEIVLPEGTCRIVASPDVTESVNEGSAKPCSFVFLDAKGKPMDIDTFSWSLYDGFKAVVNSRKDISEVPGQSCRIVLSGVNHMASTTEMLSRIRYLVVMVTYTSKLGQDLTAVAEFEYRVTPVTGM